MKTNSDTTPALYIGLDVHKEKTSIAIADPGSKGEVRLHGEVATTQVALERAIRRIAKSKNISVSQISICYEAGGCGMWIARMFMKMKAPWMGSGGAFQHRRWVRASHLNIFSLSSTVSPRYLTSSN